jgi:septum formation protein
MNRIILASASPRRRELLEQIGVGFEVIPAKGEERITSTQPDEVVCELSRQKAYEVAEMLDVRHTERTIVIGADTVVCVDGQILGKPKDRADAVRMIGLLQGRVHSVFTGVTVLACTADGGRKCHTFASETKVSVYPMEPDEIEQYADTEEPMDKAGAYGIQGRFAAWVRGIEGDYNNVVGLPVSALWQVLKQYM